MSPRVKSVKGQFDLNAEKLTTTVEAKITDECKLKAIHKQDGGLAIAELEGSNWKASYNLPKKDLALKVVRKHKGYDFKVTQVIPGLEWSVFPSPLLEVETQLVKRDGLTDEVDVKYDMRTRVAGVRQKLKFEDKHECVWAVDSAEKLEGASCSWKTKMNKSSVKSLTAKYSKKTGPILKYDVDPTGNTAVELEAHLNSRTLKGELKYKPEELNNAEIGLALAKSLKDDKKPNASVFIKWSF
ncbi:hypothetical protein BSKO_01299 [Bryopsis sp. KO-2023]|nr:hypothetical protein BSKO_01299 [Bryopsis sp. KO-2023]